MIPGWYSHKGSACNAGDTRDAGSVSGLGNAIHCSVLARRIPCREELGVLQSMGSQSQPWLSDWAHPHTHTHTHTHKNKLYSGRYSEKNWCRERSRHIGINWDLEPDSCLFYKNLVSLLRLSFTTWKKDNH